MIRLSIPLEENIEKRNDFWIFTVTVFCSQKKKTYCEKK